MGVKNVLIFLLLGLGLSACSNEGTYTPLASEEDPSIENPVAPRPGLKGYKVVENAMLTPLKSFVEDGKTRATGYSGVTSISTSTQKEKIVSGYQIQQQFRF